MFFSFQHKNNDYYCENGNQFRFLSCEDRLTIFVGTNNSGKSRFMRNILTSNDIFLYSENTNNVGHFVSNNICAYLDKFCSKKNIKNNNLHENLKILFDDYSLSMKDLDEKNKMIPMIYQDFNNYSILNSEYNMIYIPILRGTNNFSKYIKSKSFLQDVKMTVVEHEMLNKYLSQIDEVYKKKTIVDYSLSDSCVFTAEKLYEEIIDILLGEESNRNKFHQFEEFMSINFFDGMHFQITPNKSQEALYVKIGDNNEYPLYNLGDGIKQLITIMYPIYMFKDKKNIFFIDEPDLNLHPGLQRKLTEILLSDIFKNDKFFITTHSNSILDIVNFSDDVSIYKFKKENNKFVISHVKDDYISLLNEIGVSTSSVFLSNCSIWVEGISDRIYLKKYLELYFKKKNITKFKENIHYCFIEYGGGNLPHFNFLNKDNSEDIFIKALSHNSFLLVDNDDTAARKNKDGKVNKKESRKIQYRKNLGNDFFELKSREIENLISINILEKYLKKDNNIQDLHRKMYLDNKEYMYNQDALSKPSVKIGEFIDRVYNLNKKYSAPSGTIKEKYKFALEICKLTTDFDELSEQAQELTKIIFDFIDRNN